MFFNLDCYMDIDLMVIDKWGILVVCFYWKWFEYEINQVVYGLEMVKVLFEIMGVEVGDLLLVEQVIVKGG